MADHYVAMGVILTEEEFDLVIAYQGQFERDLPVTEGEKVDAVIHFVQELVQDWLAYQAETGDISGDDFDEDDDDFDEVGELTLQ